jgi:acetyltransferase-like isoleucine patch superfamily enzyme
VLLRAHHFFGRVSAFYWLAKTQVLDRQIFGRIGKRSRIIRPLKLRNTKNILIGENVIIESYVWLLTLPISEDRIPRMVISDGCAVGHFNHITCVDSVELGPKVLTADRVHISDNSHSYESITEAILDQPVISKGPVHIGGGTWIGENASILSCRIGRNCVIGANSVVVRDVPDFSVVAGIPGRVIKQFDPNTKTWKRTSASS